MSCNVYFTDLNIIFNFIYDLISNLIFYIISDEEVKFLITEGNNEGQFSLNPKGALTLVSSLDYEKQQKVNINFFNFQKFIFSIF